MQRSPEMSLSIAEVARFQAAQALWQSGDVERAEPLLADLFARHPAHAESAILLAKLMQTQGRLTAASMIMADHVRAIGMDADSVLRGAQFIQQSQRQQLALDLCEEAFRQGKRSAGLYALAGNIARELGDFETARRHMQTALDAGVDLDTWFVPGALATTHRYDNVDDPELKLLDQHFHNAALSTRARASCGFGLAKARDDLGDYGAAAQVLREANALAHQSHPWSRDAWRQWIDARMRARARTRALPASADFIPVFIIGLPRTGTTLTALQLARHAHVRDRGEMPHLSYIAERLIAGNHMHDASALHEGAELYRAHMRQDDAPALWYIDKNPQNIRYLDVITTLFPQAKIIHCRRDRRDNALSIWSQYFAHADYACAYDWQDIATFIDGNDALMRHWTSEPAMAIHTLDYEDLVANPEHELDRLRTFVGLDDTTTAAAASTTTAIASSSMWQARQPIYQRSVGRWRAYQPYIPELGQLFGAARD